MELVSDSIDWSSTLLSQFHFYEPSVEAELMLAHPADPSDAYRMWHFTNFTRVIIGGPGLRLTFSGTHPGLGTGDNTQAALIEFETNDGSTPELVDFRANVNNAPSYGLRFSGGALGSDGESTVNRFLTVNVAGRFLNSGVDVNSGVRDLWFHPDSFHVLDPYNRVKGWDGHVSFIRPDGIKVGCIDSKRYQYRIATGAKVQYVRKVTGGVTLEYGAPVANMFAIKYVGNGPDDPYIIRIKDFGFSGPTEMTGLPAGVMVKKVFQTTVMKNDPAPLYGETEGGFRFVRFEQLPSDYGNGMHAGRISAACAPDNTTNNDYIGGTPEIWVAEASSDGLTNPYITAFFDITIDGFSEWVDMGDSRGYFNAAGSGADVTPSGGTDRSYGHVLRATAGTEVAGITSLLDENTVTGRGGWHTIRIHPVATDQGSRINPRDNKVVDTQVGNLIDIGADASNTEIRNVRFTGSSRKIVSVGANSDVSVTSICAPAGSTIEGEGLVTYDGSVVSLPYTLSLADNCAIAPPSALKILDE
jgi:hypothetical protein